MLLLQIILRQRQEMCCQEAEAREGQLNWVVVMCIHVVNYELSAILYIIQLCNPDSDLMFRA